MKDITEYIEEKLTIKKDLSSKLSTAKDTKITEAPNDRHDLANIVKERASSSNEIDLRDIDVSKVTSFDYVFNALQNITKIDLTGWDTSNATSMASMFYCCSSLEEIVGLEMLDTSRVEKFNQMFFCCYKIKEIDLSNLSFKSARDTSDMFLHCNSATSIYLPSDSSSNIEHCHSMFEDCASLEDLYELDSIDFSHVDNMGNMFYNCKSLEKVSFGDFKCKAKCRGMFCNCNKMKEIDFSFLSESIDVSYMLNNCNSLERVPNIENVKTHNVEQFTSAFNNCEKLKSLDLSSWDFSKATHASSIFRGCKSLEDLRGIESCKRLIDLYNHSSNMFDGCNQKSVPKWAWFDKQK